MKRETRPTLLGTIVQSRCIVLLILEKNQNAKNITLDLRIIAYLTRNCQIASQEGNDLTMKTIVIIA